MDNRVDNPSSKLINDFFYFLLAKDIAGHCALVLCCIDLVMSIIIIQIDIQMQADSFVSDTNRFINFWLQSIATRGETQFLKANANHTMPTPPKHSTHRAMFKISIHSCRKTRPHASTVENSTAVFSKSSNSLDHIFWAWHHPNSSPISCVGVYYDKWCLSLH